MISFYRTVNILKLVRDKMNSEVLYFILKHVGFTEFTYEVEVTHFSPEVSSLIHSKPENCHEGETEELEFEPFYDQQYLAFTLMSQISGAVSVLPRSLSRFILGFLISHSEDNITDAFIETEEEWLKSDEAYKQAKEAVMDYLSDPEV